MDRGQTGRRGQPCSVLAIDRPAAGRRLREVLRLSTVRRPVTALLGAVACALLVWPLTSAAADAPSASRTALLAHERYLSTFSVPDPTGEPSPEERYYASYGKPAPLGAPRASAPGGEAPWALLALACGAAGSVVILARRSRVATRPRVRPRGRAA